jgi:hypothetical protein
MYGQYTGKFTHFIVCVCVCVCVPTYSFFVFCVEIHVAHMQTEFSRSFAYYVKQLIN